MSRDRPQAMGRGQQGARIENEGRAETGLPAPRVKTIATRSAKRPWCPPTRALDGAGCNATAGRPKIRKSARRARMTASCAEILRRINRAGQPASSEVRGVIHLAFSRLCEHLTVPERVIVAMAALAFRAAPRSEPRDGERERARRRGAAATRRAQTGLSRRGGNAGRSQGPQTARAVRGAQICRPAAQGGGLVGQALPCGDEFIYEITLLHRDGRLTHVEMEAGTGKLIGPQTSRARRMSRTSSRP